MKFCILLLSLSFFSSIAAAQSNPDMPEAMLYLEEFTQPVAEPPMPALFSCKIEMDEEDIEISLMDVEVLASKKYSGLLVDMSDGDQVFALYFDEDAIKELNRGQMTTAVSITGFFHPAGDELNLDLAECRR